MSEGTPAHITVRAAPVACVANADFPINAPISGNPGPEIRINVTEPCTGDYDHSAKVLVMVHELGHTLGMRHSDWQSTGEPAGGLGRNYVPGTQENDPGSVMRHAIGGLPWSGFTPDDERAAIYTYPVTPTITQISYGGGVPTISWTVAEAAISFDVSYQEYWNHEWVEGGQWGYHYQESWVESFPLATTSAFSYTDPTHTHTGASICQYGQYGQDWGYSQTRYAVRAIFPNGPGGEAWLVAQINDRTDDCY